MGKQHSFSPKVNIENNKNKLSLEDLRHEISTLSSLHNLCNNINKAKSISELKGIIETFVHQIFGDIFYTLSFFQDTPENDSVLLSNLQESLTNEYPLFLDDKILSSENPILLKDNELMKVSGIVESMIVGFQNEFGMKGFLSLHSKKQAIFSEYHRQLLSIISHIIIPRVYFIINKEHLLIQIQSSNKINQVSPFSNLKGVSPRIKEVYKLINLVAISDATVLLLGESGTGKELVAKAIHDTSIRKNRELIKVNCATIPASLLESELFGHEKGSFTGANQKRIGKFELAHESTLFLDEIGELPIELQVKLLRVLQEKEFERIGGQRTIKVNVRIIAATNRNLEGEVSEGRFRLDLYYRLNVFPISLPPLRERKEDIPLLVAHFIEKYAPKVGKKIKGISHKVLEKLLLHPWLGNIRELEHLIERSILLTTGDVIKQINFAEIPQQSNVEFEIKTLAAVEHDYILKVLKLCNGRIFGQNGAAVRLNLPPTTLISKMQKLGIKKEHFVTIK